MHRQALSAAQPPSTNLALPILSKASGYASTHVTPVVLVVVAVLVMGTRGSFGMYIAPWEELFGIGRASASLIAATGFLTYGLGQQWQGKCSNGGRPGSSSGWASSS